MSIEIDKRSNDPTLLWKAYWSKERVCKPYEKRLRLDEPIKPDHVRIVCISDTHDQMEKVVDRIPNGDVLVHCGDFSNNGMLSEIEKFDTTMVVAGNHELGFDDTEDLELRDEESRYLGTPKGYQFLQNSTLLHDKAIEIYGLKFYGSSWHPLKGYPFGCARGEELLSKWLQIPDDVDVLLTHGPPLGHMDVFKTGHRWGCAELLNTIEHRVNPKLHVFGHTHENNGMTTNGRTIFVNAAICDFSLNPVFDPLIFDLPLREGYSKI